MNGNGNPLGLPPGSVRSILALVIVLGAIGVGVYLQDMPVLEKLALLVLGFYFGQKASEGS